jgi:hypothetical protein
MSSVTRLGSVCYAWGQEKHRLMPEKKVPRFERLFRDETAIRGDRQAQFRRIASPKQEVG